MIKRKGLLLKVLYDWQFLFRWKKFVFLSVRDIIPRYYAAWYISWSRWIKWENIHWNFRGWVSDENEIQVLDANVQALDKNRNYVCLSYFCLSFIKRSKSFLKRSNNCYHLYIRRCNLEFLNHVLQIVWSFFSNYHSILLESFRWVFLNERSIYSNLNKGFWKMNFNFVDCLKVLYFGNSASVS